MCEHIAHQELYKLMQWRESSLDKLSGVRAEGGLRGEEWHYGQYGLLPSSEPWVAKMGSEGWYQSRRHVST